MHLSPVVCPPSPLHSRRSFSSLDLEGSITEKIWNSLPIVARKRLLAAAGYSKNMAYRVWIFQPPYVKSDVRAVYERGC